ncbi:MAG TPA: YdeI/OmpD-associated family protein [Draconibacterium sp.]|nr:YdeI/OmpD-associated family protein [Draconibacterium sp.]
MAKAKKIQDEYPIIPLENQELWRDWLEQNHDKVDGVWIRIYKKASGISSVKHAGALEEALCFGWIDGQANKYDEVSYLQKFTPRRAKSIWSKRNISLVKRLEKEGKMHSAGLEQIKTAKADGRLEKAYDSPSNMTMPDDFLKELAKDKKAQAFFETLNKTNIYAIGWRLQTAKKPETRQKRMKMIIEMLANEEKFH